MNSSPVSISHPFDRELSLSGSEVNCLYNLSPNFAEQRSKFIKSLREGIFYSMMFQFFRKED